MIKYKIAYFCLALHSLAVIIGCTKKEKTIPDTSRETINDEQKLNNSDIVTDIDGNIYHTVKIGDQVWMVENLKVTHYRNGELISNLADDTQWSDLRKQPAYCNYNNDSTKANIYGRLYNWHSVNDPRKIAPENWHIPSLAEWETLINYLGGSNAGGKLKASDTKYWDSPNEGGTNITGFTALPGGERNNNGTFTNIGFSGGWWTATGSDGDFASTVGLLSNSSNISTDIDDMRYGYSVRCIHD